MTTIAITKSMIPPLWSASLSHPAGDHVPVRAAAGVAQAPPAGASQGGPEDLQEAGTPRYSYPREFKIPAQANIRVLAVVSRLLGELCLPCPREGLLADLRLLGESRLLAEGAAAHERLPSPARLPGDGLLQGGPGASGRLAAPSCVICSSSVSSLSFSSSPLFSSHFSFSSTFCSISFYYSYYSFSSSSSISSTPIPPASLSGLFSISLCIIPFPSCFSTSPFIFSPPSLPFALIYPNEYLSDKLIIYHPSVRKKRKIKNAKCVNRFFFPSILWNHQRLCI